MDENKNTYQRLQAMIKDESKSELFAAGGLFSGRRDDDHSALKHFGEYVDLRKTQNKGIPTTIDSGDFMSYLGIQLADKPEELKGLVEKIETLKKHGAITEQTLANNTFYNFAVILSDLDIVANPEKITSLYEAAFEEAIGFAPSATSTVGNSVGEIKEVSPQLTDQNLKPGSDAAVPAAPALGVGNVKGETSSSSTTTTGTQTNISGAAGEMSVSLPVTKKENEITGSDLKPGPDAAVPGNVNAKTDQATVDQPYNQTPGQIPDQDKMENTEMQQREFSGLGAESEREKLSPVTTFTDQKNQVRVGQDVPHADGGQGENGKATPRFRRFSQGGSQFRHLTGGANRLSQTPTQAASGQAQQQQQQTAQSEAESESQAQRNRSEQRAGGRQEKKGSSLAKKLARLAAAGSAGGLTIPFLAPGTAAKAAVLGSSGFLHKVIEIIFS